MTPEELLRKRLSEGRFRQVQRVVKQQKLLDTAPRAAQYQGFQVDGGVIVNQLNGIKILKPISNGLIVPGREISVSGGVADFMPRVEIEQIEQIEQFDKIIAEVLSFEENFDAVQLLIKSASSQKYSLSRVGRYIKEISKSRQVTLLVDREEIIGSLYQTENHIPCFTNISGEIQESGNKFEIKFKNSENKKPYISFCQPRFLSKRLNLPVFRYNNIGVDNALINSPTVDVTDFMKNISLNDLKREKCENLFSQQNVEQIKKCKSALIWMAVQAYKESGFQRQYNVEIVGAGRISEDGKLLIPSAPDLSNGGIIQCINTYEIYSLNSNIAYLPPATSFSSNRVLMHLRPSFFTDLALEDMPIFLVACANFRFIDSVRKSYAMPLFKLDENRRNDLIFNFLLANEDSIELANEINKYDWVEIL
ncbi:MAG: hypothetical protein KME29_04770 [Calothrix sp. FI2-JRJ7]|jgi:hypothetical protein|nr:hypothetical protein [Calothrix sp. FI2-JRJ7]